MEDDNYKTLYKNFDCYYGHYIICTVVYMTHVTAYKRVSDLLST